MRHGCDQCAACCKGHLLVECDDLDILREPRLIEVDRHHAGKPMHEVVRGIRTERKAVILSSPCPFLAENRYSIYPTRPNCCVGMDAGDEQCQRRELPKHCSRWNRCLIQNDTEWVGKTARSAYNLQSSRPCRGNKKLRKPLRIAEFREWRIAGSNR